MARLNRGDSRQRLDLITNCIIVAPFSQRMTVPGQPSRSQLRSVSKVTLISIFQGRYLPLTCLENSLLVLGTLARADNHQIAVAIRITAAFLGSTHREVVTSSSQRRKSVRELELKVFCSWKDDAQACWLYLERGLNSILYCRVIKVETKTRLSPWLFWKEIIVLN